MKQMIHELVVQHLPEIKEARRYIHAHPELGFEEVMTQKYLEQVLNQYNIPNKRVAGTGILATLQGKNDGRCVLLRADMDALPIQEEVDIAYASQHPNKMHACGHDGHSAGLLGAAIVLSQMKEYFNGTIKFMFQPAEETTGGAQPMIASGILENPKVDAAFGLHLNGEVPFKHIELKSGAMYGAPDEFSIEIRGSGGHAASPHQCIDPISISTQILTSAQFILTRRLDPIKPALISFTSIHAGDGFNVIPETCTIGGTIRTLYPDTRSEIKNLLEELISSITKVNHADYTFNYMPSYPPLINDATMSEFATQTLSSYFGPDKIQQAIHPSLGAEDFAYIAEAVPSSYYNVGIKEEGCAEPIFHHPQFAWNDDVLEVCSESLIVLAINYLQSNN